MKWKKNLNFGNKRVCGKGTRGNFLRSRIIKSLTFGGFFQDHQLEIRVGNAGKLIIFFLRKEKNRKNCGSQLKLTFTGKRKNLIRKKI